MLCLLYYCFALVFLYYPYCEFKLQAYRSTPALQRYFREERDGPSCPQATSIDHPVDYKQVEVQQPSAQSIGKQEEQKWEVHKGTGIVI